VGCSNITVLPLICGPPDVAFDTVDPAEVPVDDYVLLTGQSIPVLPLISFGPYSLSA
jgi:hypothetical protein